MLDVGCSTSGGLRLRAEADAFDFHPRQLPAVSDGPVVTFTPFIFERDDFFVFPLLDNLGRDLGAGDQRISVHHVFPIGKHQDLAERGGLSWIDIQKIDIYRVAFRDAILPSASLDDCVGHNVLSGEKRPRKFPQKDVFGKQKGGSSAPSLDFKNSGGGAAIN